MSTQSAPSTDRAKDKEDLRELAALAGVHIQDSIFDSVVELIFLGAQPRDIFDALRATAVRHTAVINHRNAGESTKPSNFSGIRPTAR